MSVQIMPTTVAQLTRKIQTLLGTPLTTKKREALDDLLQIAQQAIASDSMEARNVAHYNRLVDQVMMGVRDRNSLARTLRIDDKPQSGVPHIVAQGFGLPLYADSNTTQQHGMIRFAS